MRRPLQTALVAALSVLPFLNTLDNQPVLDDGWVIFDNSLIKHLSNLGRFFREPYNVAGAATNAGLFRPITTLTYALNYAVGGGAVLGYHLVNLALHLACALLVLALAEELGRPSLGPWRARNAAAAAAAVFAVHPVHVEAVTGMVGRAEELAALAVLGSLYLLVTRQRDRWRAPLAFLAMAAGILSKENAAVALPLLILIGLLVPRALGLMDVPGLRSSSGRSALWELARLAALLAAGILVYPLLVKLGPGHLGVPANSRYFGDQPLTAVLSTETRLLVEYLRILVWPHPLGVDFYYSNRLPLVTAFGLAQLGWTALWLSVLALGWMLRRRYPLVALGALWIFAALLPVLIAGAMVTERFLYLPSVGLCLALAEIWARAEATVISRFDAAAILALGIILTFARNAEWHDPLLLWEAELLKEPTDPVVNNNVALAYTSRGDYARAAERLQVALRTQPSYWRAWVNLGITQHKLGDDATALQSYTRAAEIDPTASSPELFRGMLYFDKKDYTAAELPLRQAARLAPLDAQAHYWLGRSLFEEGKLDEARQPLTEAVELDPGTPWARELLATIAQKRGLAPSR